MQRIISLSRLLTLKRVSNYVIIVLYERIARWFKTVKTLAPYALSLELSSVCNLKCPQCPVGLGKIKRADAFINTPLAKNIIDDFARKGIILNLYFQGESLLHPSFIDIAEYAAKKKLFTILSTNATQIDEKMAAQLVGVPINRIILSIDGLNQDTYGEYRQGGQANQSWGSIKTLVNARMNNGSPWPEIIVQTLVNRFNENELDAIEIKARQAGADKVQFKTMQLYDDYDLWLPEDNNFRRYQNGRIKQLSIGACFRAFSSMVVSSDGDYLPCCFDKAANHITAGHNNSFNEAVKSTRRKKFLEKIYKEKRLHAICENCPEAMKVYKKTGKR